MVATSTIPNRIAPYPSEPAKTLPPLPASAEARSALLSDAVFAAVLALQGQLTHHDPAIVQKAAEMILDFEKTRLRHGRRVAGTERPQVLNPLPPLDPLPVPAARGNARPVNRADPFDVYVERVRQVLQSWEDEDGFDITISRGEAREYAADMIARERKRRTGEAVPPPSDPRLVPPAALVGADVPERATTRGTRTG
jgi:hypothetical protein